MLETLAGKLADKMDEAGAIRSDDKEIYVYGLSLMMAFLSSLFIILTAGILINQLIGTLLFLCAFVLLRVFSGGYHADTYAKCFLYTLLLYAIGALLYHWTVSWPQAITVGALFIAALIVFVGAPVAHPNKPMTIEQKRRNGFISKMICLLALAVYIICNIFMDSPSFFSLSLWAALGLLMASLTVLSVNRTGKEG